MIATTRTALRRALFLLGVLLLFLPETASAQTARSIVTESLRSMQRIQTLSGRIKRMERLADGLEPGELKFKLMLDPHKIYIYNYVPEEGAEVLWVNGWNKNKALIHPNKFPWVNVSFGLDADVLLRGHHPMTDLGFGYTHRVIERLMRERSDDFEEHVKYEGTRTWYGQTVHVVVVNYEEYSFDNYTVVGNEDLFDIDRKLNVPAWKVVELNDKVDDFYDIKAGQNLKVPNIYAKKVIFFFDDKYKLPVVQIVYDDQGLFSKYEYLDLRVNPRFRSDEFLSDYSEYGF
ncbi:MAG: DUF1571 domain-containing protein [Bacteroidota bacterium]